MELLAIGEVAARSGMAPSALRYYEEQGLIERDAHARRGAALSAQRAAPARRHPRGAERRARRCPRSAAALDTLPAGPAADGRRLGAAVAGLAGPAGRADRRARPSCATACSSCIGCGCLSLERCALSNPGDVAAREGSGARWLPPALRRCRRCG